jgi:hypothetical protein
VYRGAAMKRSQVFFGLRQFEEEEKIFPMNRCPKDHPPPVSMKLSLIASSETHIQQLADLRCPSVPRHKQ